MPANHGLRLDDDEGASPARPESEEGDPESPISVGDPRTSLLLDVDGELLAEGQLDEGLFSLRAKQGRQTGDKDGGVSNEGPNHRGILKLRAREIESEYCTPPLVASRTEDSGLWAADEY